MAMASTTSQQAPVVPPVEMREADHNDASLGRVASNGTWGEPERGEQVNINQALEDFRLARNTSRGSGSNVGRSSPNLGGGSKIGRVLSGGHRNKQPKITENEPDLEAAPSNENYENDFDLGKWILTRHAQAKEEGIDDGKPVGMLWRDLSITAPGAGGGGMLVKTLPVAITNTAWKDPIGVLTTLIPPLSKLFTPRNMPTTNLLHSSSGILKPGEMLLVLGRPGSGCSTVLRAITSKNHTNVSSSGKILYGGFTADEINRKYRGEVVFVDEEDTHFPTLTVGQTLNFALSTKVPHRSRRLQGESRKDFIETIIDVMLNMFKMTHVRDTIVGDQAVRGVSGGERKRVTISEALATRASVIAWDNSTRGLDASTALDYARSLRIITDLAQRSTIATLYQVSESIFDLFDRIAVIDEGRCIYYGPRKLARSYFYELGYDTPDRQTTADFVTALTDTNQVVFRKGMEGRAPKTAADRERVWRESDLYRQLESEMDSYEQHLAQAEQADQLKQTVRSEKRKGVSKGSSYTVNFWDQIVSCIWRQREYYDTIWGELQKSLTDLGVVYLLLTWMLYILLVLVKWGARGDLYVKLFTIISVSFMISSLFYNQPYDSEGVFTRGGILLFACLFNGWLQLSESFEAVAGRPMLSRHRQFAFHRPSAVVLARALVDIPFLLVQCFLSSIIIYFLANLRRDAGAFFIFYVYCFLSSYSLTALYRMCAAFSPGFNEAIRFSVLSLNVSTYTVIAPTENLSNRSN